MSGLDRLNSKLAKLKGADDDAEQIVTGATDGIIAVLLSEIEETILPREMVLTDEDGARFVLLVAGRRLLHVGETAAPGPDEDDDGDPSERIIAAFNGPFRAFLDRARELGIDAHRPHDRIDPTRIGCSVETLAQAVAGGPTAAPAADPVTEALALAAAGLRLAGGEIVARSGDAALLDRLEGFSAAATGLSRVTGEDAASPVGTIIGTPDPRGLLLARVAFRGEAALVLAPATARPALLALCRRPSPAAAPA
ncbi:hypothetical protein [Rhodovulum marinum]|uniref:Uncharacterized protein n=1 Tax=Rhodovulum marinum TaxID=320662 RepID=A0A4R2Q850_9RHOB|nr:hypothetical protein [Rhodovulum marinum]TCP44244.1 hypothetical protein EV662_101335 [Rhodovulum marinum]